MQILIAFEFVAIKRARAMGGRGFVGQSFSINSKVDIDIRELERFIESQFGLEGTLNVWPGGLSHQNFRLQSGAERYLVKLYSRTTSSTRLENEAVVLRKLERSELFSVPRLLRARNGEERVQFSGRVLSCFRAADGERRFSLTAAPKEERILREMGRFLALLHRELGEDDTFVPGALSEALSEVAPERAQMICEIRSPRIIIHGDYQAGNLLFRGEEIVGICDFEYATSDRRVLEVALACSNLLSGGNDWSGTLTFIDAYHLEAALSPDERRAIPFLIEMGLKLNLRWAEEQLKMSGGREYHLYLEQTRIVLKGITIKNRPR